MDKITGICLFLPVFFIAACSFTFTITNNCQFTIWPAILSGAGSLELSPTGLQLKPRTSYNIQATPKWSGRIWGRTGCNFDSEGNGVCLTGDCGGNLECNGRGGQPPVTLFEITLGDGNTDDYYDISLVDGYNLPIIAKPCSINGDCNATGCATNLNSGCPRELQVVDGGVVACKSACNAFGLDQYCCTGSFANPTSCKPSYYSTMFKTACPRAYSYAFDDGSSTFTCKAVAYTITFCPAVDGYYVFPSLVHLQAYKKSMTCTPNYVCLREREREPRMSHGADFMPPPPPPSPPPPPPSPNATEVDEPDIDAVSSSRPRTVYNIYLLLLTVYFAVSLSTYFDM
ncbi:Pathogenesis-related protein 5 [Nymphaea thermarum]|nr:Pathogenesis-related protein 5 [Nymphaea thermarum]